MRLLLDTHTFLWFIDDSPRLSLKGKMLLEDDNELLLSVGSLWEMAIKASLGKLTVLMPYDAFIPQQLTLNDIEVLPITVEHLAVVSVLTFHHRDPFDRLLVAQSIVEQIPVVSVDPVFDTYSVQRLW
jgi:PIN domain nuclease of toxin-antitoxin system